MKKNNIVMMDHELDKHKQIFIVDWLIGNQCNYKCSYCNSTLNNGSIPWRDSDIITGFADKIIEHHGKKLKKNIEFKFIGGEVTLYKDLYKVLKYLKDKNCKTKITTNGSQKLPYWKKMKEVLDFISLSYHVENCDPDHFYSIVKYLNKFVDIQVNIMMNIKHFDKCCTLGKRIRDTINGISINFQPLLKKLENNSSMINYSNKMLKTICNLNEKKSNTITGDTRSRGRMINYLIDGSKHSMDIVDYTIKKRNQWKGWMCWSGLEHLIITQFGEVYRGWCLQDKIGDIYSDIEFPATPTICYKNSCHCNIDILSKKQKTIYLNNENISKSLKTGINIL